MKLDTISHNWITTNQALKDFAENHKYESWIAFDTEFIGERRDRTLLCLIQVSSVQGIFLIDCIKINDLSPFLEMMVNPSILKITHAGDNDYKVLYELYRIVPVNVADVQIAAGFAGYKYPVSLATLLSSELNQKLDKSFTVIDWEQRPLHDNYVLYAIEDVLFLKDIYDRLMTRIDEAGMNSWVQSEFHHLTLLDTYASPPEKEALLAMYQTKYSTREKVMLLRLFKWRFEQAERTGKIKEKVLPRKWIGILAKQLKLGKNHLLNNRSISPNFIEANWRDLEKLNVDPNSKEELEIVNSIDTETSSDPIHESLQELVLSLVRYQCRIKGVDPAIVMPPQVLKTLKKQTNKTPSVLETTWRYDLLGKDFLGWIDFDNLLKLTFEVDRIIIEKNINK